MPFVEIESEDIFFDPKVQTLCVSPAFTCPFYGHSWACPPEAPYLEDEVKKYQKFYLIYSIFDLETYIKEIKAKHPRRSEYRIKNSFYMKSQFRGDLEEEFDKFLESFNNGNDTKLLLYDGSCKVCRNKKDGGCTYDSGKPCRYPDKRRYSMEAVGIEVIKTVIGLKSNLKLDIEYPSNKYAYRFGLACIK